MTFVIDKFCSLLPPRARSNPSGWTSFNAPCCHHRGHSQDKRKRAGVSFDVGVVYNCFNCKYTTGWTPAPHLGKKYKDLASLLGASQSELHTVQIELLKHGEELDVANPDEYVYNISKFNTVELPENTQMIDELPEEHELTQYARDRDILGLYPLLHFPDMANKRRLIVPFMYNGELVGWTGRHVNPPSKDTPKYLHNMPPGFVFNIDKFAGSDRDIVIVTEGVFDAILVDGVSVMGNSVTAEQAHLIEKLGKRVILCPDRDTAGKQLINQAMELGWEVSFPEWAADCKDAADACHKYGRLATVHSIISCATDNQTKIKVRTKML